MNYNEYLHWSCRWKRRMHTALFPGSDAAVPQHTQFHLLVMLDFNTQLTQLMVDRRNWWRCKNANANCCAMPQNYAADFQIASQRDFNCFRPHTLYAFCEENIRRVYLINAVGIYFSWKFDSLYYTPYGTVAEVKPVLTISARISSENQLRIHQIPFMFHSRTKWVRAISHENHCSSAIYGYTTQLERQKERERASHSCRDKDRQADRDGGRAQTELNEFVCWLMLAFCTIHIE